MVNVKSVLDSDYTEILDEFCDKLKILVDAISSKSIFEKSFSIN
jgi:hypothetical protein